MQNCTLNYANIKHKIAIPSELSPTAKFVLYPSSFSALKTTFNLYFVTWKIKYFYKLFVLFN